MTNLEKKPWNNKRQNKLLKSRMKYQKRFTLENISRKSFIIYKDFSLPNGLNTKSNLVIVNTEINANNMAIPVKTPK